MKGCVSGHSEWEEGTRGVCNPGLRTLEFQGLKPNSWHSLTYNSQGQAPKTAGESGEEGRLHRQTLPEPLLWARLWGQRRLRHNRDDQAHAAQQPDPGSGGASEKPREGRSLPGGAAFRKRETLSPVAACSWGQG